MDEHEHATCHDVRHVFGLIGLYIRYVSHWYDLLGQPMVGRWRQGEVSGFSAGGENLARKRGRVATHGGGSCPILPGRYSI